MNVKSDGLELFRKDSVAPRIYIIRYKLKKQPRLQEKYKNKYFVETMMD